MSKRKRQAYDNAFKLRVVDYAESSNNCAAQREFGVSDKLVRDWRKTKDKIADASKTQKRKVICISPYDNLESDLNNWVQDLRKSGFGVTRNAIRVKALQLAKEAKYGIDRAAFKASSGWCNRFMSRHNLVIRQRTHIAQKLPADVDDKVMSFHQFVIRHRKQLDFELGQIGNMDETPMFFDMPGSSTVNTIGEKTVTMRTSGSEKSHFTVVLACMADGTKLKPMVVFKCKTMPKDTFPPGLLVCVQEKGWVGNVVLAEWLEKVWFRRPGGTLICPL